MGRKFDRSIVTGRGSSGQKEVSLYSYLARLIWICILPLIVIALAFACYHAFFVMAQEKDEAAERVQNVAMTIDQMLGERISTLQVLTESPLLDDLSHLSGAYQEAQGFYRRFGSHVILADLSMQMLFNTRVPLGTDLPKLPVPGGHAAVPTLLETGKPSVGDTFIGPIADEPLIALAVPVMRQEKIQAILLSIMAISEFQSRLAEIVLPPTWSLLVVDSKDIEIVRLSSEGLDNTSPERFVVRSALSPWSVVLEISGETALKPMFVSAAALIGMLLAVAMMSVLGGRMASRRLTCAVQTLTTATKETGRYPHLTEIEKARDHLRCAEAYQAAAQEELKTREELFRNLFENHAAVKLIIHPGTGQIIDANQAAENFYGWSKPQLKQMKIQDINTLSPDAVNREMEKVRERGKVYFEFQHRRADGSIRDVAVYTSKIDVKGKPYLHSIVHDMTERKAAEKALRSSEERFRLLVENAPEAIFVQTGGRFTYLNAAALELFGAKSGDELKGIPVSNRFHPDIDDVGRERMLILNQGKRNMPLFEDVYLRLDGSSVHVEVSAVPITFDDQEAALVFVRDISERLEAQKSHQQLENQLHQAQKIESVGRLAGGVAHDYNNMLSVILGYTELAKMKLGPDESVQEELDQVLTAAKRSRDITRQLLAFARQQPIAPKVLDLNQAVEHALKMLKHLLGENIELIWQPQDNLWPVEMDPSQLDQVLANLCVNARDAITDVGKMTVETANLSLDRNDLMVHQEFVTGDYVALTISDDGCGMNRETQERIFEPFFTTKAIGKGTGLGLATVYGIVKQNKGFVNVYSELGKGSAFRIYLPKYSGRGTSGKKAVSENVAEGHGETVLLVEDEEAILNMTATVLTDLGYKVLAANSPSVALSLAKEQAGSVDLVVTDVVMPGMNGKELAEQLRLRHPGIQCLYMSGYTASVIAQHGVLEEGVHFLQKPFSRADLSVSVRKVLDGEGMPERNWEA